MTSINNTKAMQVQPKHPNVFEIYQDEQGRDWLMEAIDQLIVGHVHGGYTFTPIAICLSRLPHLSNITSEEAEAVFHKVVQKTEPPFVDWRSVPSSDPTVQEILMDINEAVGDALTEYLDTRGHYID